MSSRAPGSDRFVGKRKIDGISGKASTRGTLRARNAWIFSCARCAGKNDSAARGFSERTI
jgi:hypothetical protein